MPTLAPAPAPTEPSAGASALAATQADGDTLFALATGASGLAPDLTLLGALAAEVTARAVLRGVQQATGLPGLPALRDLAR